MDLQPDHNPIAPTPVEPMSLTEAELQALFADIKVQAEKARKAGRRLILTTALLCLAVPLILVFLAPVLVVLSESLTWLVVPLMLIPAMIGLGRAQRRQKQAVERLMEAQDVRMVGPLADILSFTDHNSRAMARQALLEFLPRLKASDAHLLNAQHRENLRIVLLGQDKALILALLAAYRQIGDERDLPAVQGFLQGKEARSRKSVDMRAANIPEVRQAALDCLPFLQEKAQQSRISEMLLRASDPPAAAPEELLRSAAPTDAGEPEKLLRAANRQP